MSCPYLDCTRERIDAAAQRCPQCSRNVRVCPECADHNRPFASYCRSCGESLPPPVGDWIGHRGGPQRLALNRTRGSQRFHVVSDEAEPVFSLDSACRGLLFSEGHLIAISESGLARLRDVDGAVSGEWTFEGPLCGMPVIGAGSLYVGTPRGVTAFTLGGVTGRSPGLDSRWRIALPGQPTGPLTTWDRNLYLTVALDDRRMAVMVIPDAAHLTPGKPRVLAESPRLSWLTGSPPPVEGLYCLAEDDGEVQLLQVEAPGSSDPELLQRSLRDVPLPLQEHRPVATIGRRVFTVLQEDDTLCSIDVSRGRFARRFRDDVRDYVLSSPRSGIAVHGGGLFALADNQDEKHDYLRNVRCSPVLVEDFAVFLGLPNGNVRYHRLDNLPAYEDLRRPERARADITALASAGDLLAAGDARGAVDLWRFETGSSRKRS